MKIVIDILHVFIYDITMGKNRLFLKLIWIFLLLLCFASCNNSDTEVDYKAESLKIYRLLIRHYYSNDEEGTVLINLYSSELGAHFIYEQLLYKNPEIDREALKDFIEKNRDASIIAFDFSLDVRYRFLSFLHDKDPIEHDRKLKNYGNRVKKLCPYSRKKIIEFSKVGFNKKANQAIVRYAIYGSSLSLFPNGTDTADEDFIGFGRTVLLEKTMGPSLHVWTIKNPRLE